MSSSPEVVAPLSTLRIDLNADLGEGFPNDRLLLGLVTSASICCGAHAGGPDVSRRALRDAGVRRVAVGAHPGYDDREGFGRRDRKLTTSQVRDLVTAQVGSLMAIAAELGMKLEYVKPHGALYNQAQVSAEVAEGVVRAVKVFSLPLLGQPASLLASVAGAHRLRYVAEGFPDRRYRQDGSLVPRSAPDAVLHTPGEVEAQVVRLVNQGVVQTLCIHGDDPRAVANARLVREVLDRRGIAVRGFTDRSR
jgi:5-oxoprolinase (ATP-hydrolysing) subunit A